MNMFMDIYTIFIIVGLFVLGAIMGSFVGAMTWRMRHHRDWVNGRSECEHCHHQLSVLDLIPILSWLCLRGKCRYCHKPIGWTTFLLETGVGLAFVLSFFFYPWSLGMSSLDLTNITVVYGNKLIISFAIWLVEVVLMSALSVYDARWKILPNKLVFPLIGVAAVNSLYCELIMPWLDGGNLGELAINWLATIGLAMLPIAGVYGLLYLVSKGKWIGFGDVKLGIAIGFMVPWLQGLFVLLGANLLSTIVAIPLLMSKKLKLASEIPFGPYLIVATYLIVLFGRPLVALLMSQFAWI